MIKVRRGQKEDLPTVLELIVELAIYEKAEDEVINTVAMMERDGFGDHPAYGFFVAEKSDQIIGLALYYYRYSTWKGRRLYLEDIVVTESERGAGAGKLLMEACMQQAIDDDCSGMMWQVLDWNKPAIDFYTKKYGAKLDGEWINCSMEREDIVKVFA